MNKVWVNGVQADTVSVSDRGFSYGDGIFTTIKVVDGHCQLLTQHLIRLQQGITALAISQIDFKALLDDIKGKALTLHSGVIKIVITRGIGQRGYSSVGCDSPTTVVSTNPLPSHYELWQQQGIDIGVSTVALGINPLTAGLKHLNRLEQVLVKQQVDEYGWADALVLDCQACIIETSMANIFWRTGDVLYTPSLDFSGVKGLVRQEIMALAQQWSLPMVEDRFKLSSIFDSDEIFITNCLMGVVPITGIESKSYAIGDLTRRLQKSINVATLSPKED